MKRTTIVFILASVLSLHLFAQKPAPVEVVQVPVDAITKLITYEGVTEVTSVKSDVLYNRMLAWFKTFYKNPMEVIRENDSLKFRIVGKPRFKISGLPNKDGIRRDDGLVQYTITVAAKDGRFKYEITEFNWKQASYFACERWMDTKSQSYSASYAEYLKELDQYTNDLIKNLKGAVMTEKPVKDKDSW